MQLLFKLEIQGLLRQKLDEIYLKNIIDTFLISFYERDKEKINTTKILYCVLGISKELEKIDNIIEENTKSWRIDRLDAIDRAILRLGTFEITIAKERQYKVLINDAVEIAKKFASEQSSSFINGILDSIKNKNYSF